MVYWEQLKKNRDIRELLALFCRLRIPIDLELATSWEDEEVVRRFADQTQHYFHKETPTRWFFFHNSFRQFVLDVTGRNIVGVADSSKHSGYHRKLADLAAKAERGTPWAWEELYHRACAGDTLGVLHLFSQGNFRCQFMELRQFGDIIEDITLCLKAARVQHDALAVVRAFLIESELRERNDNLKDADFPLLLLKLFGKNAAVDYVIRGRELRLPDKEALEFSRKLVDYGEIEAAQRIFSAAEPLEILTGSKKVGHLRGEYKELEAWAAIAHYFRPIEKIISTIDNLELELKNFHETDTENASLILRDRIMNTLAHAVYLEGNPKRCKKFKDIMKKLNYLLILQKLDDMFYFLLL